MDPMYDIYNRTSSGTKFLSRVYMWMTLALILTGLTSLVVFKTSLDILISNSLIYLGLIIAELVLVFILSWALDKMNFETALLIFLLYSVINGITLTPVLYVYTEASVFLVFFITAGMFAAMSLIGFFIKKDLSGMGRFLFMALIGLLIALLINIFLGSDLMSLLLSVAAVFIFAGLTAYDTQKIKKMGMYNASQKTAIRGALSLYLDFINLFINLLRLLGNRR